jgi:hypothetical protein
MPQVALVLAFGAMFAVGLPAPGQYLAIGFGIAAIGTGRVAFARRALPGLSRLAGAAAITVGAIALLLGLARVAITLAAIRHLERLVG